MSTTPAKHIIKNLAASVQITGFAASGADDVVTSVLTAALSTAGDKGVSVPLQVSTSESVLGVIVAAPNNRIEIWATATKNKLNDANGEEVYGRITHAGGVYTLTYYSLNPTTGAETAYSFGSSTNIDFEFNYRFDFNRYPTDAAIAVKSRNISDDPSVGGGTFFPQQLTVTAQNTISNLSKTPTSATSVFLIVNGITYDAFPTAAFSVSGKAVTWSAANAGFNIDTTDRVIAWYFTNE